MECSCFVLDRCLSATSIIISLKGSSSHYDSECGWRESLKKERNRGEKEQKVGRSVFHSANMGGSASLTNAWVKKFQELKCSMP